MQNQSQIKTPVRVKIKKKPPPWQCTRCTLPWPGFEPGLLRPQRRVLTTRRSRLSEDLQSGTQLAQLEPDRARLARRCVKVQTHISTGESIDISCESACHAFLSAYQLGPVDDIIILVAGKVERAQSGC